MQTPCGIDLFLNMTRGLAYCRSICDDTGRPVDYAILEATAPMPTYTRPSRATSRRSEDIEKRKRLSQGSYGTPEIVEHLFEPLLAMKPPGEGGDFKEYLPATGADEQASPREDAPAPGHPRRATVLIVEDESAVRELIAMELEDFGYRTLQAEGLEDAVAAARGHSGDIDVLVSDVVLPGADGIEVAEAVRRERPEIMVVLMSGYSESHFEGRTGQTFDAAFIEKPFTGRDLGTMIAGLLAEGRGRSGS